MKITPLTAENISYVVDNLWCRGYLELEALKWTPKDLKKKFMRFIGKPFTASIYDNKGECCAIIAMESCGPQKWNTLFFATEDGFSNCWFPLTRFLSKITTKIVKDTGGEIKAISAWQPLNLSVCKWFKSMKFACAGFDRDFMVHVKKVV